MHSFLTKWDIWLPEKCNSRGLVECKNVPSAMCPDYHHGLACDIMDPVELEAWSVCTVVALRVAWLSMFALARNGFRVSLASAWLGH
jgi:hypothetical protein